jgi:hypothetical protein
LNCSEIDESYFRLHHGQYYDSTTADGIKEMVDMAAVRRLQDMQEATAASAVAAAAAASTPQLQLQQQQHQLQVPVLEQSGGVLQM